jgi:glutaredoxin
MPFLRALEMHFSPDRATASMPEALRRQIESVSLPADLKIYVTPQCPFCPHVLSEIVPLALLNPLLHLDVIDGALFPELAEGDGVRSVPTVILDGAFRWTGAGHRDEIVNAVLNRDPARLGTKSLENFLKEGNAGALAQMMIDRRQVFPAFTDLLESPDWSVRLGAMVVVEEIAEKSPDLLAEMLDVLWNRLQDIKGPARGDVLYLFGFGQPAKLWIDRLNGLLENEDEKGREAVMEALEKLS